MESKEEGDFVIARLDEGEDVFKSIKGLAEKHGIKSGMIVSSIGMLHKVMLGYYNGMRYVEKHYENPSELVSMHGSITADGLHIHVCIGDEHNVAHCGHLIAGEVAVQNELVILKLRNVKLKRVERGRLKVLGIE